MNRNAARGLAAVAIFLGLAAQQLNHHYPAPANPLTIDLALERGTAGRADPVIVTGQTDAGDFLTVRFDDEHTVRFIYDSWGYPGISSQPVRLSGSGTLHLRVSLPSLDQVQGEIAAPSNRVRVECNDVGVLDTVAHYFRREPDQIFFGANPLGGTACGTMLHGRIIRPDGRELRGGASEIFSRRERISDWLTKSFGRMIGLLLISAALVFVGEKIVATPRTARHVPHFIRDHAWFLGTALLASVSYAWLVTLGTFRFNVPEIFGSFYDYQASSLLQGQLDVPEDAIGGEAFEARGKL